MLQDIQPIQCFPELMDTLILFFSAENATLHKYILQDSRSMFRTSPEVIGNSVLILSQRKLVNDSCFPHPKDSFFSQVSSTYNIFKSKTL